MEFNRRTLLLISVLLFHSILESHSHPSPEKTYPYATSNTPPVLIPRLETWARAMQLSFRSISEPPQQSQFPSHSSRMASIPYIETSESETESHSVQPTPFLDGNSDVLGKTMKSIAWLIKLGSMQAQRLSNKLGNPYDEAKILKICKDRYDNASSNLQEAMKALSAKNVERMNSMLNAVLSDVGDCRDEYLGKHSPLATYDDKVTKMTNNCLVVLDLVYERC